MTWLTILGAVVTALLPLLIKLIDRGIEAEDQLDSMSTFVESRARFNDLADAIDNRDSRDVAAVWSRHDRMLFEHGIVPRGTGDGNRGLRDLPESGRYVDGQRSVDAQASRVRTGVDLRVREVSTSVSPVIPIL